MSGPIGSSPDMSGTYLASQKNQALLTDHKGARHKDLDWFHSLHSGKVDQGSWCWWLSLVDWSGPKGALQTLCNISHLQPQETILLTILDFDVLPRRVLLLMLGHIVWTSENSRFLMSGTIRRWHLRSQAGPADYIYSKLFIIAEGTRYNGQANTSGPLWSSPDLKLDCLNMVVTQRIMKWSDIFTVEEGWHRQTMCLPNLGPLELTKLQPTLFQIDEWLIPESLKKPDVKLPSKKPMILFQPLWKDSEANGVVSNLHLATLLNPKSGSSFQGFPCTSHTVTLKLLFQLVNCSFLLKNTRSPSFICTICGHSCQQ